MRDQKFRIRLAICVILIGCQPVVGQNQPAKLTGGTTLIDYVSRPDLQRELGITPDSTEASEISKVRNAFQNDLSDELRNARMNFALINWNVFH